jgi:chromosome segregation ATPase
MRPREVQDADVIEAGRRLQQNRPDARISGYALRKELEGRGTPAILMAIWDEYVQTQLDPTASQVVQSLPDGADDILRQLMRQQSATLRSVATELQKAANRQAELKIAEQGAAIVQLKASHDQELRALEQVIETMRTKAVRNVAEIQSLAVHLAAEQHQRTSMTSQLALLRASTEGDALKIADQQLELSQALGRIQQLESDLSDQSAELLHASEELATLQHSRDQLQLTCDAVGDMNNQRKAQLDLANEKINSLNTRIADLTSQLDAYRTDSHRAWQTVRTLEAAQNVLTSRLGGPGVVVPIKEPMNRA